MPYVPPHKRHFVGGSAAHGPTPTPALPPPSLSKLSLSSLPQPPKDGGRRPLHDSPRTSRRAYPTDTGFNIIYADGAISRWWWASAGGRVRPDDLRLECFPCEDAERRYGAKPFVLVADASAQGGGDGEAQVGGSGDERPTSIARRVLPDLIAAAASARGTAAAANEVVKLSVSARVGKVFFRRGSSTCLESLKSAVSESNAGIRMSKRFHTDVTTQLLDDIEQIVVPKAGFDFELEKEEYRVKIFDKCRPGLTIACKCVAVNGSLRIHKIELNHVRHLVADVSCLHKDFDLRIILVTKKFLNSLDDAVKNGINGLISAAIIDTDVKGGLRWPLGKDALDERFSIVGAWHTRSRTFRSSRMRLKLRNSDRYSHITSVGEVSDEVTIKLTGIAKHLRVVDVETSSLLEMLEEAVELIWNDFLSFKPASS